MKAEEAAEYIKSIVEGKNPLPKECKKCALCGGRPPASLGMFYPGHKTNAEIAPLGKMHTFVYALCATCMASPNLQWQLDRLEGEYIEELKRQGEAN